MTNFKPSLLVVALLSLSLFVRAQSLTQTVRGTVIDKISKMGLPGATVVILNTDPLLGATTDADGNFRISEVQVGTQTIKISFVGYKDVTTNVVVNSGKEVVLNIPIEEDITQLAEVVVRPDAEKNKPLNEMAVVSTRTFSVEETRKFAAAVNDPARAAVSFAGVVSADDGNNSISIRGNSPFGLLWRMEGVDIPNPNHFAVVGSSGGGISILSSQLLANSDFSTGAFAAEYGNALAGVFDLNLRKGNNENREYTIQAGVLGLDVAAEGPFSKNYRGSYLINYRYSTLSLVSKIGVNIGDAVTNFQDLSYNIYLPTSNFGNFSLFGFGGLSDQNQQAKKDSTVWEFDYERYNSNYFSNTGAAGFKHAYTINPNAYLQTTVVLSGNNHGYEDERLDNDYTPHFNYIQKYSNRKITFSSVLNQKFSGKSAMRAGVYLNRHTYTINQRYRDAELDEVVEPLNSKLHAHTVQAFSQWNYKVSEHFSFNAGVHSLYLANNNTFSLEPRASVKYDLSEQQSFSLGYGLHSQMQPISVYEVKVEQPDGTTTQPNLKLDFNKAHHLVFGYDRSLSRYLRIKAETYYQHLYNIAVRNDVNRPISTLVLEQGFEAEPMVNKGLGRNYGIELTLEQFLHNDLYFLLSASLYNSEYKALDNVWRNSRFNGKHAVTFTAGKEYNWKKGRVFGINLRTIYTGGFWTTPIDITKSVELGETHYLETLSFTQQLPDYFRTDVRFSIKRNKARTTSTLSLDLQNATNRKNLGGQYFEPQSGKIEKWYMMPLLPVLSYKIEF